MLKKYFSLFLMSFNIKSQLLILIQNPYPEEEVPLNDCLLTGISSGKNKKATSRVFREMAFLLNSKLKGPSGHSFNTVSRRRL